MRIYKKLFAIVFILSLLAGLTAAAPQKGQQTGKSGKRSGPSEMPVEKQMELHNKAAKLPAGPNFFIEAVAGQPVQYSILMTDSDNRSVPGTFILPQIDIFQALLLAAKKFALTDEEVGTASQPKITRFVDKNEGAFFIDIQKAGVESHFFVTLKSLFGTVTIDAGAIRRGPKKNDQDEPEPLFYKIITRVEAAKAAVPTAPQTQY